MPDSGDPRLKLLYDESLRARGQQDAQRADLHSRASALMTASSIAAAFLGGRAVGNRFGGWTWLAVAAFIATIGLGIYALAPRRGWTLSTSARRLLVDYVRASEPTSIDDMHRDLALHFEVDYDTNTKAVGRVTLAVQVQCVLLLVQLAAWLLDLRGRG